MDCGFKGHERNASIFIGFPLQMARNQFASNRTWVRIPPAAPRRSKLYIVCSDFFQKVRAHSFRCSSFSSRKRFAGLRLDEMGALDWCIFFVNIVHVGAGFVSLAPIYFISQIYVSQNENLAGSRILAAGFFFGAPLELQNQIGTEVSLRPLSPGLYIVHRPGFVHIKAKRREKRVVFCEMRREMGNMGQAN